MEVSFGDGFIRINLQGGCGQRRLKPKWVACASCWRTSYRITQTIEKAVVRLDALELLGRHVERLEKSIYRTTRDVDF